MIGTVRDIMAEVRSPRAVFVDYPSGRTFGRPGDGPQHERVLAAGLAQLPLFTQWGQIRDLPFEWESGSRQWETQLRDELLKPAFSGAALEQVISLRKPRS